MKKTAALFLLLLASVAGFSQAQEFATRPAAPPRPTTPVVQAVRTPREVWLATPSFDALLNAVVPIPTLDSLRRIAFPSPYVTYRLTDSLRAGDFRLVAVAAPSQTDDDGVRLRTQAGRLLVRQGLSGPWRPEWYGGRGDNATLSHAAIQKCLTNSPVGTVVALGGQYRVAGKLTVPEGKTLTAHANRIDRGGLRVDTTYRGTVIELRGGASLYDLPIFASDETRDNDTLQVGVACEEDAQNVTVRSVKVYGLSVGFKLKAFFHNLYDVNAENCNWGLWLKGRQNFAFSYTGSLKVFGAKFLRCSKAAIYADGWVGDSDFYGVSAETCQYFLHNAGGKIKLYPTYLGDGPRYAIYNQKGYSFVDCGGTATLHGGGRTFIPAGQSIRQGYMGGGVWCQEGTVEIHNARFHWNVSETYGYSNEAPFGGGENRGHAVRVDSGAVVKVSNVSYDVLFPVVGRGEITGDEIPNYATGGTLADTLRAVWNLTNLGQLKFLGNSNNQGGRVANLTQRGGVYFSVEPWRVGTIMYLVVQTRKVWTNGAWNIGDPDNPAFGGRTSTGWARVPNAGATARYHALSLASMAADNIAIPAPAYADQPRVDWIPIRITRQRGIINLYNPTAVQLGYLCLVGPEYFGRLGWYKEVNRNSMTHEAQPNTGYWENGDVVERMVVSEAGSAGSKYISEGYRRLTYGTGTALGNDWVERRVPTGN